MARIELSNTGGGTTLSLTTTGTSGASTLAGSVLNIPVYQGQLTLTTTGTSGAATLVGDTLNIPQYSGGGTPAGSTGEIQYNNAGAFAASANLAWDNSNVRLNIGAPSAPTARLNVRGGGTTSTTATQILTNSGNSELMRINDAGRVGIGIAPDATAFLNVNGSVYCGEFALRTNPTTSYGFSGNQCVLVANGTQGIRISQNGTLIGTASSIPNFNNCVIRGRNTSVDEFALNVQNSTPTDLYKVENNGRITYWATNTAAGTTGAQTINRPSGTVNFAAVATALVVTNSLCTTASLVFAEVRTNDATAQIKNVVPAAGSFTINLSAAATAETSVGFFIIN